MGKKILVIGGAILDVLARPAGPAVFRTGSCPVQDLRMSIGGDAANEAIVLAGLGKKAELRTVLGDDMAGRMILNTLREKGVEVSESCLKAGMVTGINNVLVREDGERCFLTNPNGSLRKLTIDDIPMPFAKDVGILALASIFVSPGLGSKELETALPPGFWQPSRKAGTRASAQNSPPSAAPGQ